MATLSEIFGVAASDISEIFGKSITDIQYMWSNVEIAVSGVEGAKRVQTPEVTPRDVQTPSVDYLTDMSLSNTLTISSSTLSHSLGADLTIVHVPTVGINLVLSSSNHTHTTNGDLALTGVSTLVTNSATHSQTVNGDLTITTATGFTWASALRALYYLENVNDSSGNSQTLSMTGVTTSTDKIQGTYSASFAGAGNLHRLNTDLFAGFPGKSTDGSKNFLITGWFKINSIPSGGTDIVAKYYTETNGRSFKIGISGATSSPANALFFYVSSNGTAADNTTKIFNLSQGDGTDKFPTAMVTGQWYHIAIWHDNSLDKVGITLYWNDGTAHTVYFSEAFTTDLILSTSCFSIGAGVNTAGTGSMENFNGLIDDIRIYGWGDTTHPTQLEIINQIQTIGGYTID